MACSMGNLMGMMLSTETSWQGGIPPRYLPGYQAFHKQRPAGQKRGGGLAILVKEGITAYTWNPNREAWPQDSTTHSEILWLIIPSPKFDIAVGVVYLASGHKHKEWNEALHDALTQDITALQEEGMKILQRTCRPGHRRQHHRHRPKWESSGDAPSRLQPSNCEL